LRLIKKFTTTQNYLTSYTKLVYKGCSMFSHWPFREAADLVSPISWNCPFKEKGREFWRSAWSNILWLVLTFSAHAGLREKGQFRYRNDLILEVFFILLLPYKGKHLLYPYSAWIFRYRKHHQIIFLCMHIWRLKELLTINIQVMCCRSILKEAWKYSVF
jgi:hypothetical protein